MSKINSGKNTWILFSGAASGGIVLVIELSVWNDIIKKSQDNFLCYLGHIHITIKVYQLEQTVHFYNGLLQMPLRSKFNLAIDNVLRSRGGGERVWVRVIRLVMGRGYKYMYVPTTAVLTFSWFSDWYVGSSDNSMWQCLQFPTVVLRARVIELRVGVPEPVVLCDWVFVGTRQSKHML